MISRMERACEFQDNGDPDATKGMCTWEDLGLSMVLTGPVPITNAVTEFSFKLFWEFSRTQWFLSPSGCLFSTRTFFKQASRASDLFKASKSSLSPVYQRFALCFGPSVSLDGQITRSP